MASSRHLCVPVCVCVFSMVYMLCAVKFSMELQLPKDPGMFMGLFWSACAYTFTHADNPALPQPYTPNNRSTP